MILNITIYNLRNNNRIMAKETNKSSCCYESDQPLAMPRGGSSRPIQFPASYITAEQKLLYVFRREGAQPFSNLPFLVELSLEEIKTALRVLEDRNNIKKYQPRQNGEILISLA